MVSPITEVFLRIALPNTQFLGNILDVPVNNDSQKKKKMNNEKKKIRTNAVSSNKSEIIVWHLFSHRLRFVGNEFIFIIFVWNKFMTWHWPNPCICFKQNKNLFIKKKKIGGFEKRSLNVKTIINNCEILFLRETILLKWYQPKIYGTLNCFSNWVEKGVSPESEIKSNDPD